MISRGVVGWLLTFALLLGGPMLALAQAPNGGRGHEVRPITPTTQPAPHPRTSISGRSPTSPKRPQPAPRPMPDPDTPPMSHKPGPQVELLITYEGQPWGRIVIELTEDATPATVQNFLQYVDEGFYDGTIFHRLLPDFVIQGGAYTSLTDKKTDGLHEPIRNESRRATLRNVRGTVAMARKVDPNSATSQFFINVKDNPQLDFPRAGAAGYTAFGEVVEGMDLVDRLANIQTQVSPQAQRRFERYRAEGQTVEMAEKSQPKHPPVIEKARRLETPVARQILMRPEIKGGSGLPESPAPTDQEGRAPAEPAESQPGTQPAVPGQPEPDR